MDYSTEIFTPKTGSPFTTAEFWGVSQSQSECEALAVW